MNREQIGRVMRGKRREFEETLDELAHILNVPVQQVIDVETGGDYPVSLLEGYANRYGVDLIYGFGYRRENVGGPWPGTAAVEEDARRWDVRPTFEMEVRAPTAADAVILVADQLRAAGVGEFLVSCETHVQGRRPRSATHVQVTGTVPLSGGPDPEGDQE